MCKILIPTAYNPSILYFALIRLYKNVCIEIHETFPKQTWRNRCSILTSQGVLNLTIPIRHNHNFRTCDVEIDDLQKWQNNHWRAIESAYNKSPFFMYYRDDLQQLIYQKETNLVRYNHHILMFFLKSYKIDTNIYYTESYEKTVLDKMDMRERLHPKKEPIISNQLFPKYYQVFGSQFQPNLSILDLLNNEGTEGIGYIESLCKILTENLQLETENGG